jgi:hypothetical protein
VSWQMWTHNISIIVTISLEQSCPSLPKKKIEGEEKVMEEIIFTHSFSKYLLYTYYMLCLTLSVGNIIEA